MLYWGEWFIKCWLKSVIAVIAFGFAVVGIVIIASNPVLIVVTFVALIVYFGNKHSKNNNAVATQPFKSGRPYKEV